MRISLRAFSLDDIPFLERVSLFGDAADFMSRWSPHSFARGCWPDDLTRWHVIVTGGHDVGTVWMERDAGSPSVCELGILIFDPASRGRGYGTQAVLLAEQDAVACWGVNLIRLRVRASNKRAISCYQKCGYRISATTIKQIGDSSVEVLQMEHRPDTPTLP